MKRIFFFCLCIGLISPGRALSSLAPTPYTPTVLKQEGVDTGKVYNASVDEGFRGIQFPTNSLITYKLAEPVFGITTYDFGAGDQSQNYLLKIYTGIVRFLVVIVVYQIIYGGVTYTVSASGAIKNDARERIQKALGGLALALGSYLILNTINPDLINFRLKIDPIEEKNTQNSETVPLSFYATEADYTAIDSAFSGSAVNRTQGISYINTPKTNLTEAQIAEIDAREQANRKKFSDAQIGINTKYGTQIPKDPCPPGVSFRTISGGCTSTAGLNGSTISGTIAIKQACRGCVVTISGGSEAGHKTHSEGNRVDLEKDPALDAYFLKKFQEENGAGAKPSVSPIGRYKVYNLGKYTVMDEGNHWHVTFLVQ